MAVQMRPVFSSHVAAIGYDNGDLHVQYNNGRSGFFAGVPEALANQVMTAPSVGSALHAQIRGTFQWSYND